jgi:hypothetical protein
MLSDWRERFVKVEEMITNSVSIKSFFDIFKSHVFGKGLGRA